MSTPIGSPPPDRKSLEAALRESGEAVGAWLERAFQGEVRLALKQNGMRLPEKVAIQGLWGTWIFGKDA